MDTSEGAREVGSFLEEACNTCMPRETSEDYGIKDGVDLQDSIYAGVLGGGRYDA